MKLDLQRHYSETPDTLNTSIEGVKSNNYNIYTPDVKTDEYEPTSKVKSIIQEYERYLAERLADDLITSFKPDWYLENGFSKELVEYLAEININRLVWRLRYQSCLTSEGFLFPFKYNEDIVWQNVSHYDVNWSQRFNDNYLSIAFYLVPIKGIFRRQYLVSFYSNIILELQLTEQSYGNKLTEDNFRYFDNVIKKVPFNTDNKLLLVHWPNNFKYEDIFTNIRWELRVLAQAGFQLIDDIQLAGVRIYKMSSDKLLNESNLDPNNPVYLKQKKYYRNERQPIISKHADLTSPSAIGSFTPTSTVSAFDSDLIIKQKLWNTITRKLNLFIVDSAKGSAQQHSTEILLQNNHAIQLGKKKVAELKIILIQMLNIIIDVKGFSDAPVLISNFVLDYQLPFLDVLKEVSTVIGGTLNDS